MKTVQFPYRCQEDEGDEFDEEKHRQAYIEEPDEEDSDADEEMDEM